MKKLLIITAFLMFTLTSISQKTFVKKYTSYITVNTETKTKSAWEDLDLTVVFNEKETDNIVMYYPDRVKKLYKVGVVENGKTTDGDSYQAIECIDDEGDKVYLQLFQDGLRLLITGAYIEFH